MGGIAVAGLAGHVAGPHVGVSQQVSSELESHLLHQPGIGGPMVSQVSLQGAPAGVGSRRGLFDGRRTAWQVPPDESSERIDRVELGVTGEVNGGLATLALLGW